EAAQAVLDVLAGGPGIAATVLGHQEALLALAVLGQGLAHDLLTAAVVIVPGIVEEGQALLEGAVHDVDRFVLVLGRADVPAAQADDRYPDAGLAERPRRQARRRRLVDFRGRRRQAEGGAGGERGLEKVTSALILGVVGEGIAVSHETLLADRVR